MTDTSISPLRRRMTEDMTVRGFAIKTQTGYLRTVRDFAAFLGRSPDQADGEELRRYQLHMRSNGASATSMNAAVSALRFFFGVTVGRGDAHGATPSVPPPRSPPLSLARRVVPRLLLAPPLLYDCSDGVFPGLEDKAALFNGLAW